MNRVLSFPQRHSCDDPSEAVSKRFCFSCIFSVSFISLVIGYLLGSRRPPNLNLIFVRSERDYLEMLNEVRFDNKSIIESSISTNVSENNYVEATLLRDHFQANRFDRISEIFATTISLTFRDQTRPDTIEIVGDKEGVHYRYRKDTHYPYIIPPEAKNIQKLESNITGLPIYGNFGTEDDFFYILQKNITIHNHIVILRLGRISIFEKVTRTLKKGAKGVLLFADPQQYPQIRNDSIQEDLSPLLITRLKKFQETCACGSNCNTVVHVISARVAEYILKDIETVNVSPDSWRGSLAVSYSIGPGFNRKNWNLFVSSHFISVQFTSYDIAGYLRGVDEPDRYVIVSASRKSLRKLDNFSDNTNALMEIARSLADLRHSRKWVPTRTVIFLSIGLEGLELYGHSWMQKHVDIIAHGTVAHLNMKSPVQGLQFNLEVCPILESLFANLTYSIKNGLIPTHPRIIDIDKLISQSYGETECTDESFGSNSRSLYNWNDDTNTTNSVLSSYFGIPAISSAFKEKTTDSVPLLYEQFENAYSGKHRADVIKLWSFLTFTLTSRKILPFNFTLYSSAIESYNQSISSCRESPRYLLMNENYAKFSHSLRNLTALSMKTFQKEIHESSNKNLYTNRIINEKLMQMQKLFTCVFEVFELILSHLNAITTLIKADVLENKLNKGETCALEIDYYLQNPFY